MRVAVDATPLLVRSAGVKNYLYYWIRAMQRIAPPGTIRTFPGVDLESPLRHDKSMAGPGATAFGLGALAASNYLRAPAIDWFARGCGVFHATNLVRNPPRKLRLTSTIHDMTSWTMPAFHSASTRRADESAAELFRKADRLIAVSESTRRDAVKILNLPPERIQVIHSGVADSFFNVQPSSVEEIRAKYRLNRPFVLSLGVIEPRKNISMLLDAWESVPECFTRHFELVIAGPLGWADSATAKRVQAGGIARYLGYVPEADLAPLTAAASIFAYVSLYEGFGFPLAQAMAAGVACVTSNVSSMPEIAGDAALLVDPRSQSELVGAFVRLMESPDLRREISVKAREQSSRFKWKRAAEESLAFFSRALA